MRRTMRNRSHPSGAIPQSSASVVRNWGSRVSERELSFQCDAHLVDPDGSYFRAVSVNAPPSITFRWLCQLRIAPYSYDFVDNPGFYVGRPSPKTLTPGADALQVGQTFMTMFRLVDYEPDRHITLVSHRFSRIFGEVAVTYLVLPEPPGCRLVVKLLGRYAANPIGKLIQPPLPWLDLVMMHRQLTRLKRYAERDARRAGERSRPDASRDP